MRPQISTKQALEGASLSYLYLHTLFDYTSEFYYTTILLRTSHTIYETKKKARSHKEEEEIQFKNRQQASHRLYNRQI